MPLDPLHLQALGFSPRLAALWRREIGPALLPLQEKAVRASPGLLQGRDLVVFAPTASGKTFLGEMASLRWIEQGRPAVYLVPTRSLAEEKARLFTSRYRELRLRIVCSTRERPENDSLAAEGKFDWLVAVYEKFAAFLVSRPALLGRLGGVVADELQLLGDRDRGPMLDVLLTKIRRANLRATPPIQFLGLSAVLANAASVAQWLGADLLHEATRPVDLHEGVVDLETSEFHWRSFNTGAQGREPLAAGAAAAAMDMSDPLRREGVLALAGWIARERAEQTLVFVPMKWMSRAWAEEAAARMGLSPAEEALKALERHPASLGREQLAACLRGGVAFHNADLPSGLRRLVEEHFRSGAIRALFSTPTLAQGVNLAGRNVIQVPWMVAEDALSGQPALQPLARERFRNQGGRAARTGMETRPGRSMIAAAGEAEIERLMRLLVEGPLEPVEAPLRDADPAPALLDLVAGGAAQTPNDLADFLMSTFTGRAHWIGREALVREKIEQALERLEGARLIGRRAARGGRGGGGSGGEEMRIVAGGLAQAVASAAIAPETASLLIEWLETRMSGRPGRKETRDLKDERDERDPKNIKNRAGGSGLAPRQARSPRRAFVAPIEALLVVASTGEMRTYLPPLLGRERTDCLLASLLRERLEESGCCCGGGGRAGDYAMRDMEESEAGEENGRAWSGGEDVEFFRDRLAPPTGLTAEDRRAAKLALLLDEWIGPGETEEIERRYGVLAGSIAAAGAQAAWLVRTASALASALGLPGVPVTLERLADRLEPGVAEEGIALVRLRIEGLGRSEVAALLREGIRREEDLRECPVECLERLLAPEVARAICERFAEEPAEFAAAGAAAAAAPAAALKSALVENAAECEIPNPPAPIRPISLPAGTMPPQKPESNSESCEKKGNAAEHLAPVLVVDSTSAGIVEWEGRAIELSPLHFRLVHAVAKKPGLGVTYRELTDFIWKGEARVEQQMINWHRRRMLDESFAPLLGRKRARALITPRPGLGLVLNLKPEQVRLVE